MKIKFVQKFIDKIRGKKKQTYKVGKATTILQPAYINDDCEIGNYTFIGHNVNIVRAKVGNYCSIGNYVSIGPNEHDMTTISTSDAFVENKKEWYKEISKLDCEIGNDVWIGVNSVIKRGVKVGNGAVIGANSFVNKDVLAFAVVAATPAKIIKYRFEEEKRNRNLASNWWNKDLDEAKEIIKYL